MSNLLFNIRFGSKHFQLTRDWQVYWEHNNAHDYQRTQPGWKWFEVYCMFGRHF